jgi:glutathione S-transferase
MQINPYKVDPNTPGGYTKKSLSLEEKRKRNPDFIKASPRGLVPALSHTTVDGSQRVIWESLPAAEYANQVFGDGSLMPVDPYEKAMVQIWCEHCTHRIQKSYYSALMAQDPDKREEHLQQYYTECRALANAMSDQGPFFLGDRFSMLEVVFAPFWQRMLWVGQHYMPTLTLFPKHDDLDFQRLHAWWKATSARPSVAATLVCKPRMIASYADYALNVATSDFAKSLN